MLSIQKRVILQYWKLFNKATRIEYQFKYIAKKISEPYNFTL